jgi:hypothetical protein
MHFWILLWSTLLSFGFNLIGILFALMMFISYLFRSLYRKIVNKKSIICFTAKNKEILSRFSWNIIYVYGIKNSSKLLKNINIIGYSIFVAYILSYLVLCFFPVTTLGDYISVTEEHQVIRGPYMGPWDNYFYNLIINVNGSYQQYKLNSKEMDKCNWDNVSKISIKHNWLWYDAPRSNVILECN